MLMAMLYGAKDLRLERGEDPAVGPGQVKVRFGAGGICGSDLSYYGKGRVGDFAVMQPLCLGHEVSGEVDEVGAGETRYSSKRTWARLFRHRTHASAGAKPGVHRMAQTAHARGSLGQC